MRYGYADTALRIISRTLYGKFNIVCNNMSRNELYVALSRATKISQVGITWNDQHFKFETPTPVKLHKMVQNQLFEGIVYNITCEGIKTAYGGKTRRDIETRFKEHQRCPTNVKMEDFMKEKDIKINEIARYMFINAKQLDDLEKYYISLIERDNCMNVQNLNNLKKPPVATYVPLEAIYKKLEIRDDEKFKRFRIRWTENGVNKEKEFSYAKRNKKDIKNDAIEFRSELMKRLL